MKTRQILSVLIISLCCCCDRSGQTQKGNESDPLNTKPVKPIFPTEEIDSLRNLTVDDLWESYNAIKDEVEGLPAEENILQTIVKLHMAAKYAMALERPDIAAWQLNNIGYYSILVFQQKTEYQDKLRRMEAMPADSSKFNYMERIRLVFRENFKLLSQASRYLEKAYELDSRFEEKDRTQKIYNNLKFIDWVRNFINKR